MIGSDGDGAAGAGGAQAGGSGGPVRPTLPEDARGAAPEAASGATDAAAPDAAAAAPLPPRDYPALRDLLASGRVRLPRRLAQVAAFALANPDDVAFGTVARIAERAEVQPSALVRFSQAVGFSGFSDLQALFRDRLRDRTGGYDARLAALRADRRGASAATLALDGFAAATGRSIAALGERIDPAAVDRAVALLAGAETIYLLAQRRAYPVAVTLSYALGKLGVRSVLVGSPAGTDVETVAFATERDAAVAISFTPYAPLTVDLARRVKARTPLVVLTDSPFSPLVADAAVWFEVVEADYKGFRTLAASMALAMTLAVAVGEARGL